MVFGTRLRGASSVPRRGEELGSRSRRPDLVGRGSRMSSVSSREAGVCHYGLSLGLRTAEPLVYRVLPAERARCLVAPPPQPSMTSASDRHNGARLGDLSGLTLKSGSRCLASLGTSGYVREPRPKISALLTPGFQLLLVGHLSPELLPVLRS